MGPTPPPQVVVDCDSHVTEARDTWTSRMSVTRWGDLIPRVEFDERIRKDCWIAGGKNIGPVGMSTTLVKDPDTGERTRYCNGLRIPKLWDDLHPSAYDAKERLQVMDELGVQAAALYPNFNLIASDLHTSVDDLSFQLEVIRAYNDWLIEWTSVDPGRLIPLALVPHFDVQAAAAEALRCREIGHRGLVMTGMPQLHGQPYLADRHWDPLWSAAQEASLPISFHLGGNRDMAEAHISKERIALEGLPTMSARSVTGIFFDNAVTLNDLLFSGVLARFPELRFVCAETGMGWVPFCLESADYHFRKFAVADDRPELEELPSFYFRRQVFATYWFETLEQYHLDVVGQDNLLFETDYPHVGSLEASEVQWTVENGLAGIPDEARQRVLWRNAAELYGLDDLLIKAG